MMNAKTRAAIGLIASLGATACATNQSRFEWGRYDTSLYAYSKHPEKLPIFESSLEEAISRGKEKGHVAPGLQAELGYLYLGEGKRAEAIEQFNAEMTMFPESRLFLTKIIAQSQS